MLLHTAAGGLGVWAVMAMRQAARRSSSTIARATSSQASTPLTQAQQESNMNNYMAQQPLPPMINNNIKQQNMSRPRNRYEPVWYVKVNAIYCTVNIIILYSYFSQLSISTKLTNISIHN